MMGEIDVAPASSAASTTARSCTGSSEMPGRIGAINTLVGMPASVRVRIASMRAFGCGVPGSVRRQTSSSSVPIENAALTDVTSAAAVSRSRSRVMSVPFVRIENGLRYSVSAPMMPRINRYRPSTRW